MKESAQAQKALGIILPVLLALLIFILWQSQVIHAMLRTDVFTLPLPTRIAAIIHDNWSAILVNIKSTVPERNVALVIQILDMRHEPTADDFDMINFLIERDLPFLVVCTKSDKLNKTQFNTQNAYFDDLFREHEIPFIPYSSQTGFGLETLKQHIEAAVLGN